MKFLKQFLKKICAEAAVLRCLQDRCPEKIYKLHIDTPALESLFKIKRLQYRCFPVNFAKLLRTPFLQSTSGGVGACLLKILRLRVHKKVFEWLAVNELLSNSMKFLHANSKNYLRYLHFLCIHFLYSVFFLLMKISNTSAWRKFHSIKLSGSGKQKVFLWICWRNI